MDPLKIGFRGDYGTHTESAIKRLFSTHPTLKARPFEPIAFSTQSALFAAVLSNTVTYALTTIESSLTGTIHETVAAIVHSAAPSPYTASTNRLYVAGEYIHVEPYVLLAPKNASMETITHVYSHADVLVQCSPFLVDKLPNAQRVITNGTGSAAKHVADKNSASYAAIAGYDAAQLYDLQVLGVAHDTNKHPMLTKFWLLSSKPVRAERHLEPRTSIAIRTMNRTGAFFKVLGCFAMRDINVVKIESKPHSKSIQHAHAPWEYELYVDVEGAPESDDKVENALENVKEFTNQVVVLGSYPRYLVDDAPSMNPFGM